MLVLGDWEACLGAPARPCVACLRFLYNSNKLNQRTSNKRTDGWTSEYASAMSEGKRSGRESGDGGPLLLSIEEVL